MHTFDAPNNVFEIFSKSASSSINIIHRDYIYGYNFLRFQNSVSIPTSHRQISNLAFFATSNRKYPTYASSPIRSFNFATRNAITVPQHYLSKPNQIQLRTISVSTEGFINDPVSNNPKHHPLES